MVLQFGVLDHIEPQEGSTLKQSSNLRLTQIERLDKAGFSAYHLAEHHSPAAYSLAPSQNGTRGFRRHNVGEGRNCQWRGVPPKGLMDVVRGYSAATPVVSSASGADQASYP